MTTDQKARNTPISWWMYLLNGVLFLVLGIWMLKTPRESFTAIMIIVGMILSFSGLAQVFVSIYFRKVLFQWIWSLAAGFVDIVIGLLLIGKPEAILVIITFFISFWLIVRGILLVRDALEQKKQGSDNWKLPLIPGIGLLILAVVLIWHPQIIGLTLMIWLGVSFMGLGLLRIILAFKIKGMSGT